MNDVKSCGRSESSRLYPVERNPKKLLGGTVNSDSLGFVRVLGSRGKSVCPTTLSTAMPVYPLTHLRKLFFTYESPCNRQTARPCRRRGSFNYVRKGTCLLRAGSFVCVYANFPVHGLPPASAGGRSGTLTLYYIKQNSRLLVASIPLLT